MLGLRARACGGELVPRIECIEEQGRDQFGQIQARIGLNNGREWAGAMIERGLVWKVTGDDLDELRWRIATRKCPREKVESCELGDPNCQCMEEAKRRIAERTVH